MKSRGGDRSKNPSHSLLLTPHAGTGPTSPPAQQPPTLGGAAPRVLARTSASSSPWPCGTHGAVCFLDPFPPGEACPNTPPRVPGQPGQPRQPLPAPYPSSPVHPTRPGVQGAVHSAPVRALGLGKHAPLKIPVFICNRPKQQAFLKSATFGPTKASAQMQLSPSGSDFKPELTLSDVS